MVESLGFENRRIKDGQMVESILGEDLNFSEVEKQTDYWTAQARKYLIEALGV